jgi:hypothetical protein
MSLGGKSDNIGNGLGEKQELGEGILGNKDHHLDAWFSKEAYVDENERRDGPEGNYDYAKEFSNNNTATYIDNKDKDITVAMRGSKTATDWLQNTNILRGTPFLDTDVSRDRKLVRRLKKEYPDYKIHTTGHSRAGWRARELAYNNPNITATTFNAGHGLGFRDNIINMACGLGSTNYRCKNVKNYRTAGDIVSGAGIINSTTIKKSREGNDPISSHKIDNFISPQFI